MKFIIIKNNNIGTHNDEESQLETAWTGRIMVNFKMVVWGPGKKRWRRAQRNIYIYIYIEREREKQSA